MNKDLKLISDDSYGTQKRVHFVCEKIAEESPNIIMDIGCGTGMLLTRDVAKAFPKITIHGVESDLTTVEYAKKANGDISNMTFFEEAPKEQKYDMIIASEVLEHVDDPNAFLQYLYSKLNPGGSLLITVPNGYGIFEFLSSVETILRIFYRFFVPKQKSNMPQTEGLMTLAISPHLNFFSFRRLKRIFSESGFRIESYRGRMIACGIFVSPMIQKFSALTRLNLTLADTMPPAAVSDWMFLLRKGEKRVIAAKPRHSLYTAIKRQLSVKLTQQG